GYGISLHELGRTVHRTVEVRLTRYLVAPPAGFIFIYETCREVGIDRHLLARHCIERETGCYLGHTPGTLRDDDEIDAHKDDEDHQSHGEVAAHHELAERLNHRACMSFGEYESGTAHVQGKPEEGEQEQQRGKAAEIQWIGGLQCHQQNHYGDADYASEREVQQHRGKRNHEQCDDKNHCDCKPDLRIAATVVVEQV